MTNTDFTLQREILLALRARLQGDMTQMEDNALNGDRNKTISMPTSLAELGSDNFDQEFTLSLLGNDKDAINQIDAAIERIDDGSYGRCKTCDGRIPKARLEAILYAAQCVRCASQQEEGHGGLNHWAVPATRGQRTSEDANGDV